MRSLARFDTTVRQTLLRFEMLDPRRVLAASGDVVIRWNEALLDAARQETEHVGPGWTSRNMAIVHTAMYDAINAIVGTHLSFYTSSTAPPWASREAAVSAAAFATISSLYPGYADEAAQLHEEVTAAIPDGPAEEAGLAMGQIVASQILTLRQDDGAGAPTDYLTKAEPGHWQPDPTQPAVQQPLSPEWGEVKPFAVPTAKHFIPPLMPDLTSAEYAAAFNEVNELGARDSRTRTPEQTEIGYFWAYDRLGMGSPLVLYNQAAQQVAIQEGNDLFENARLFALVNLAMADAGVTAWHAKYHYDFWRPVTAIRAGETDGNPDTIADPAWTPLGAPDPANGNFTPPFPAYTSGHSTFGAAAFQAMANFFGRDDLEFSLQSDELPGIVRHFDSFSEAIIENGRSRIYLGIHWNFDDSAGQASGRSIASFITTHFLVPKEDALVYLRLDGGGNRAYAAAGAADFTIDRNDDELIVYDNVRQQIAISAACDDVRHVGFLGANGHSDFVTILARSPLNLPEGIHVTGGNDYDRLFVRGSAAADTALVSSDVFTVNDLVVEISNLGWLGFDLESGDDLLQVEGDQDDRDLYLAGGPGRDIYDLSPEQAEVFVRDYSGIDTISFARSAAGINVDLSLNAGQDQPSASVDFLLAIDGNIERLVGTQYDDRVRGNRLNNVLWLLGGNNVAHAAGGNDVVYGGSGTDFLFGNEGHDRLVGAAGNDVVVGGGGDDMLFGNLGRDLLIGGRGRDALFGEAGEDLLITGYTSFDAQLAALQAIMAEWSSDRSYETRVANLSGNGSGASANGNYFLITRGPRRTVFDDNNYDQAYGGTGIDWLLIGRGDQARQ